MTAFPQTSPLEPARKSRSRWRLALVAFVLTLFALLVLVAGSAMAYERSLDGRVLPGVTVGGVALDGLDRGAAEERLLAGLPDPTAGQLTLSVGDQSRSLSYAQIGRRYELAPALDEALGLGRDGGPLERAGDHLRTLWRGTSYEVSVTYDAAAVERAVTELVTSIEQPLIDARVRSRAGRYVAHPSSTGVEVDEASLRAAAHAALAGLGNGTASTTASAEPLITEPTSRTEVAEA
ncbi:MAG: peptidoglycan binding domain-containing protein, partial [Chloroflexi bacterium]|nr:peptidoglycan binding domain-containing protein [Chloroflexota bacterium]